MNKFTAAFCYTILQLDRIPRYGRVYEWIEGQEFSPAIWIWQKHGLWGTCILDDLGLLWKFIQYTNPDIKEWYES